MKIHADDYLATTRIGHFPALRVRYSCRWLAKSGSIVDNGRNSPSTTTSGSIARNFVLTQFRDRQGGSDKNHFRPRK